MRWEEGKCLRHTWTGEWWINAASNRRRAASINPSTLTAKHQSRCRVEKRPAFSLSGYSSAKTPLHIQADICKSTEKKAFGVNETSDFLLRWTHMVSSSFFPLCDKQTEISQLIFLMFFPTTFPGCPTALPVYNRVTCQTKPKPEPDMEAATAGVKQCKSLETPRSPGGIWPLWFYQIWFYFVSVLLSVSLLP